MKFNRIKNKENSNTPHKVRVTLIKVKIVGHSKSLKDNDVN